MKAVIHINQHNIRHNINCSVEDRKDVITCKTYKNNTYSNSLLIVDNDGNVIAKVVYSPDKPLSCGARVWIETDEKNVRY
jgi:hypothetical protein